MNSRIRKVNNIAVLTYLQSGTSIFIWTKKKSRCKDFKDWYNPRP